MNRLTLMIVGLALALGLAVFGSPAIAETAEEAFARLEKAGESLKSWEMVMETTSKSDFMDMSGTMSTVSKRDGKIVKSYTEMDSKTKITAMNMEQATKAKIVCDGKIVWSETTTNGQVMVMKAPYTGDTSGIEGMKELLKNGKWTVKPSETIDGDKCTVLEQVSGEGAEAISTTWWYSDKTGMMRKSEISGKTMGKMTSVVKSFKENPTIDESKFNYTPPAGAQVMDAGNPGGAVPAIPGVK